jgi:hypothetical protein
MEGLAMENLSLFYDHLVYFMAIGNILWPFGIFCGNLVYFGTFWYFGPRKIWQPCLVVLLPAGSKSLWETVSLIAVEKNYDGFWFDFLLQVCFEEFYNMMTAS